MNIQITADSLEVTPKLHRQIEAKLVEKIDKLLVHFSPEQKTANLHIKREKFGDYSLKFEMSLPGKEVIIAEYNHKLFVSSLVGLRSQIEKQLRRYKQELANYSLG